MFMMGRMWSCCGSFNVSSLDSRGALDDSRQQCQGGSCLNGICGGSAVSCLKTANGDIKTDWVLCLFSCLYLVLVES